MPADIIATALANASARRAEGAAAEEADASGRLGQFRKLMEASTFSSNVTADKLMVYADLSRVVDSRTLWIYLAGGDTKAGLRAFADSQGSYLIRRELFEDLWYHGRALVYGVVNAGGMGTEGLFGPWCLVIGSPEEPPPEALAIVPGDSIGRYTTATGGINEAAARAEVTAWAQRADLGIATHHRTVLAADQNDWPSIVCSPPVYFEALRAGPLPASSVNEIRLRELYAERLDNLQARALIGSDLDATERNEVAAHDIAHRWRRSFGTLITLLPNG